MREKKLASVCLLATLESLFPSHRHTHIKPFDTVLNMDIELVNASS